MPAILNEYPSRTITNMQTIYDILQQQTVGAMVPMIINYYRTHLDIHLSTIQYGSSKEKNIGYQYALHSTKKLPKNSLTVRSHHFPLPLDTGECSSFLTSHLVPILNISYEDLKILKSFLVALKNKYLTQQAISDLPEAAITLRFVESLYTAVNLKIRDHLLEKMSEPLSNKQQLLNPLISQINELILLTPELSIEYLLLFKELVTRQHALLKSEESSSETEAALTQTETALDATIHKHLLRLNLATDPSAIVVDLPDLKTQILVKKNIVASPKSNYKDLNAALDITIKSGLLEYLLTYEKNVNDSVFDCYKTKKLALIQQLRRACTEDTELESLYDIMRKNESLLTTDSIGQYLYACFCYLFGMKNNRLNFGMTLFTTVAPKTMGIEISEPTPTNTKMKHD